MFFFDPQRQQWYFMNGSQRVYVQNSPCSGNLPPPRSVTTREDIGLVPDEKGKVQPMISFLDYSPVQPGQLHLGDRLDLIMVAEVNWVLPFDTDADLVQSIPRSSISAHFLPINERELPQPIEIRIAQVSLGDTIQILTRMGISEMSYTKPEGTYVFRLGVDKETQKPAVNVFSNNALVRNVLLL